MIKSNGAAAGFMQNQRGQMNGVALGECIPKRTVATEALDMLERLTQRASSLADRAHQRLAPVMSQEQPCDVCGTEPERYWPPMFADFRHNFERIDMALSAIDDALSRVEI